jgi:dipeptidyl aminopeptidase/acylaminoacyl peptidase
VTNNPHADTGPEWSPDGNTVYFASNRAGQSEIYRMNPDGTLVSRVMAADLADTVPAASPDGNKIAFDRTSEDSHGHLDDDIYWMSSTGLLGRKLTNDGVSGEPDWQAGETEKPAVTCDPADGLWHATNVLIHCAARDDGVGLANPGGRLGCRLRRVRLSARAQSTQRVLRGRGPPTPR